MAPAPIDQCHQADDHRRRTSIVLVCVVGGSKGHAACEDGLDAAQDHAGAHEEHAEMKRLGKREQLAGDHRHDADDHRGIFEERDQPHFAAV